MAHYIYEHSELDTATPSGGVVDGDTVDCRLERDIGFGVVSVIRLRFRLNGINCAELRGGTIETKLLAQKAKARLTELLTGKIFTLISHKSSKYGLWLADIYTGDDETGDQIYVNELMVDEGLAVSYDGQTAR